MGIMMATDTPGGTIPGVPPSRQVGLVTEVCWSAVVEEPELRGTPAKSNRKKIACRTRARRCSL